jgi:ribosomal protein S27AE
MKTPRDTLSACGALPIVGTTAGSMFRVSCGVCTSHVGIDAFDITERGVVLMEYTCPACGPGVVQLDRESWENVLRVPLGIPEVPFPSIQAFPSRSVD